MGVQALYGRRPGNAVLLCRQLRVSPAAARTLMGFGERYLDSLKTAPRAKRRGLTLTLSITFHAGALAFAIFWGFFHVEELPAPPVTVTFFAAGAPPPPPPPPPPPKKAKTQTPKHD